MARASLLSFFAACLWLTPACSAKQGTAHEGASAGAAEGEAPTVTFQAATADAADTVVKLSVANKPSERAKGLMYVDALPEYEGMLFVFPNDADHSFWMQNTHIALDMIFIDTDLKVVGIVASAEPMTTTSRHVGAASRYVVEVNGGFAAKHGIAAGTRVNIDSSALATED